MPDPSEPAGRSGRGAHGGVFVLDDGTEVELAGLSDRAAARFLDPVVVCLILLVALIPAPIWGYLLEVCLGDAFCERVLLLDVRRIADGTVWFVGYVVMVLYESATIGLSGQTWGKRSRRVRVVHLGGGTPSAGKALVRCLVPAAAGFAVTASGVLADSRVLELAGLGLWFAVPMSAMWGRNGRGWHDKAAGTIVVVDWQRL